MYKKRCCRCMHGLMILMIMPVIAFAQPNGGTITPERMVTFINNQMNQLHISGLSASVIVGDEVVWKGNFGLANRETNTPVSDSTLFLLYSVTKPFTGMALMQLAEEGLLDLDAPINDYLPFDVVHPDYPAITLTARMLMGHVGSISDNWSVINALMTTGEDTPISLETFLSGYLVPGGTWYNANASFSSHAPGTHFSYSNVGATLAGYLVEAISGESYATYCANHLFAPLEMEDSGFYLSELDTTKLAMPYAFTGSGYQPTGYISNPTLPAGFLRASRDHLDHLLCCLLNGGEYAGNAILQAASVGEMITPQYPAIEPSTGLLMGYDASNQVWGHSGGYGGVKTALFFNCEEKWGINVLTNGAGEPWQIIFMLEQFAREYQLFTTTELAFSEDNGNGIIDPGETVLLTGSFRSNTQQDYSQITFLLSTPDADIDVNTGTWTAYNFPAGETVTFAPTPFVFSVSDGATPHQVWFYVDALRDGTPVGRDSFELYLGSAHVWLMDDENSLYRGMTHPATYYRDALAGIPVRVNYMDLTRWTLPAPSAMQEADAVIWFTGLTGGNILTAVEQELLSDYLDQGGNLFLTGQLIAADTLAAEFLSVRMGCNDGGVWNGTKRITGNPLSFVGHGISSLLEGGTGSGTQVGIHRLILQPDGFPVLHYATDTMAIAMVGTSKTGKTLFAGFGFEGVAEEADRDTLMQRIIRWFGPMTGIRDQQWGDQSINPGSLQIYPNPVFREMTMAYVLDQPQEVLIGIYSVYGQRIVSRNRGLQPAGNHTETFDITTLSPGIYVCTVQTGNHIFINRLIRE